MKIIYSGYDIFNPVLEAILDAGADVPVVCTLKEDDYYNKSEIVSKLAKNNNSLIHRGPIHKEKLINFSEKYGADLFISAATPYMVPIIENMRMINIHPSYLPDGRGPWPIPYFLLGKEKLFGVSIHEMTAETDAGPILMREKLPVTKHDRYETLVVKAQLKMAEMIKQLLSDFDHHWDRRVQQQSGSYFPFPTDEAQTLNWSMTVSEITSNISAYSLNEMSAEWDGQSWLVSDACGYKEKHRFPLGEVVSRYHGNVAIAVRDGIVVFSRFRPEE